MLEEVGQLRRRTASGSLVTLQIDSTSSSDGRGCSQLAQVIIQWYRCCRGVHAQKAGSVAEAAMLLFSWFALRNLAEVAALGIKSTSDASLQPSSKPVRILKDKAV